MRDSEFDAGDDAGSSHGRSGPGNGHAGPGGPGGHGAILPFPLDGLMSLACPILALTRAPLEELDVDELLDRLRVRCGDIRPLRRRRRGDLLTFLNHDLGEPVADGVLPSQHVFLPGTTPDQELLQLAAQQSWDWPEGAVAARDSRGCVTIAHALAGRSPFRARLQALFGAAAAFADIAPCAAMLWLPAQKLVDPARLRGVDLARHAEEWFPCTVNVRIYQYADDSPDELVMDTVGLAVFGLPDLQCCFRDLDQNSMASLLYSYAFQMCERGSEIGDGDTIEGIRSKERWRCRRQSSLLPPFRSVVDIAPGRHAAGRRQR